MSIDNRDQDIEQIPMPPNVPDNASGLSPELLLDAPHETETIPAVTPNALPKTQEVHTGLRGFWDKKIGKVTLITAALLTVGGGTGATVAAAEGAFNSPDQTTQSGPATLPSSSPEATTTPEASPSASPEVGNEALDQAIQKYLDMPLADFKELPPTEKKAFPALLLKRDLPKFVTDYARVSKSSADVLPVASINSSPADIVKLGEWQNYFAFTLTGDQREKYLEAIYTDGINSGAYTYYENWSNKYPQAFTGGAIAFDKWATPTTINSSGPLEKSPTTTFMDINITPQGQSAYTDRFTLNEVVTPVGTIELWERR